MIGFDRRKLASVYEDARNVGLVLIGAGILGLGGLTDVTSGALAIIALGTILWVLSILRPTPMGQE